MSDERDRTVIGVLALQGDFAAHQAALVDLGVDARPVRKIEQLDDVDGLVIPGGESTTLIKLLNAFDMWDALRDWIAAGHPVFGTCAGAILLARRVSGPSQASFGLIDIDVERNSYGRQVDSFEGTGTFTPTPGEARDIDMVFIRAPRILRLGEQVTALGVCGDDTVIARQDHVLVSTFHPELDAGAEMHRYFLDMVRSAVD